LIRDVQSVVFLSPFSLEIHVFLIVRSLYRSELYIRKKSEDTKGVIRTQLPKEKGQKDKQRSTKHTYKTKDRVTRTPHVLNINVFTNGLINQPW
jgi:hypothetical protein